MTVKDAVTLLRFNQQFPKEFPELISTAYKTVINYLIEEFAKHQEYCLSLTNGKKGSNSTKKGAKKEVKRKTKKTPKQTPKYKKVRRAG